MFEYVEDDLDQFAYLADVCLVMGAMTSGLFLLKIDEPVLVRKSKAKWESQWGFAPLAAADTPYLNAGGDDLITESDLEEDPLP